MESLKVILDYIPCAERTNIGVITYGNTVQLYSCVSSEASSVYMCDIMNPFCPLPKSAFMFNIVKERNKLESVFGKISRLYDGSIKTSVHGSAGSSAGSAIKLAIDSLKGYTGRILWFCIDIPSLGYGSLTSRNNPQLYNTDKERLIYTRSNIYKNLLDGCRVGRVGIDVFACGGREMDLATIGAVANDTGGELYYYQQFNSLAYSLLIKE